MARVRNRKNRPSESQPKRRDKSVKEVPKKSKFCSRCLSTVVFIVALLGALAGIGYYRAPFTARAWDEIPLSVEFIESLEINRRLTQGSKVAGFPGPESFAEDGNKNIYTGLEDGRIVKIAPSKKGELFRGESTNVTTGSFSEMIRAMPARNHGRPLGLRLQKDILYVADANYGVYSVELSSNKITTLVAIDDVNPPLGFPDDLYVTKDKKFIYFTDGSGKYPYDRLLYMFAEGLCDGRVLQYNIKTKEVRVILSQLCFPNGIQFSSDETLLLLSETIGYKVDIFDTSSWKEIHSIPLPFLPDNIRPTGKGTYWVAGSVSRNGATIFLERNPAVRQVLAGLFSYETLMGSARPKAHNMIAEITDDGEIVQSLHDQEGKLTHGLTEATTLSDGRLALGSFIAPYLSILDGKDVALGLQKD